MHLDLGASAEYFEHLERKEFLRKLLLALLNHENRIRVLEGKPEITKAQLIAALKSL